MKDLTLALMAGIDIPVPSCQIEIHQPKIKEIAKLGIQEYLLGVSILCVDKNNYFKDEDALSQINNFQIFQTLMSDSSFDDKKNYVLQSLLILLPKYKVFLTPQSIILNDNLKETNQFIVDENNFEDFQFVLKKIVGVDKNSKDDMVLNPKKGKAEEIAKKIMRGRERIAAEKNSSSSDILTQYISTLVVGLNSMSLEDALNLTIFQLYDLIERYTLYINWDLDIKSRLAGATGDKPVENWMKNIH